MLYASSTSSTTESKRPVERYPVSGALYDTRLMGVSFPLMLALHRDERDNANSLSEAFLCRIACQESCKGSKSYGRDCKCKSCGELY